MKMNSKKSFWRALLFLLVLTIYVGLSYTLSDFYEMPIKGVKDLCVTFAQFITIEFAIFLLMWLLSCNKYVFAVGFPLFTLMCSLATYFRYTAHVCLTADTVGLALVNDVRTTMDVITVPLILFILLNECVCLGAIYVRFKYVQFKYEYIQMLLSLVLVGIYINIPQIGMPINNRIPFVIYAAVSEYFGNKAIIDENRPAFKKTAVCGSDSVDVVFILGETLRSKNMQINGYGRATTPYLLKDSNIVSMPHIYSEYGFTHTSVPYLLTRACPKHLDVAYKERSFIDLFKKAGFYTTWITNQESVATFIYFINEADSLIYANSGKSVYVFDQWLDADLLPHLDRQIQKKPSHHKNLYVLHTIGSHWWYKAHYPRQFAKWKPELKSRVLSSNTEEEFINSYDNSVLYSDYFWNEVRNRFRNHNAIIIYLSDHAESLGENGIFGHGEDSEALHYPGCWIWMSPIYKKNHADKWIHLQKNAQKRYNSAFLFHSILDAGDISTPYLEKQYDIFQ